MTTDRIKRPEDPTILVAEDVEDDLFFISRAMEQEGIRNRLVSVRNGAELVEYLRGSGRYENRKKYPLPGLVLLDLKMPKMDGFEVLAWIGKQPNFGGMPVVVISDSLIAADREKALKMGAREYRAKPKALEMPGMLREVCDRWLKSAGQEKRKRQHS